MDRRQRRLLAAAIFSRAVFLVYASLLACSLQADEPTPAPSPSPVFSTPAPRSSPVEAPPWGNAPGSNPRPWEWRSWSSADNPDKDVPNKPVPPAPGTHEKSGPEPEDPGAVQRIIEQLPPEERAVFTRNLKRWSQMTFEERQTLRRQAGERRQRMVEEMEGALRESGLHLDNDRREVFMLRYGQERRKLERDLQAKIAAERARRTPEIIERLKKEFGSASAPPPAPTPAAPASSPSSRL